MCCGRYERISTLLGPDKGNLPEVLSLFEKRSLIGDVMLSMIMISVLRLFSEDLDPEAGFSRDKEDVIRAGVIFGAL